jgi:hypothetical protein
MIPKRREDMVVAAVVCMSVMIIPHIYYFVSTKV